MSLTILPLTPDRWPALENLFGSKKGACNGCWCMYWRIGANYHKRQRELNKEAFREIVNAGPPPGLLAFDGDLSVGWCQVTPRKVLPYLDNGRRIKLVDEQPVWSVSCFYIRVGYRKKGVMSALIRVALEYAKRQGAPAVEAYPVDREKAFSYTGYSKTFRSAGFRVVASPHPARPILRHDLVGIQP